MKKSISEISSVACLVLALVFVALAFLLPVKTVVSDVSDAAPPYTQGELQIVGESGFYFRALSNDTCEYEDYTGANLFTQAEIDGIVQNIITHKTEAEYSGTELYVVLVPSKMSVYGDKLPENVRSAAASQRRYTQTASALAAAGINTVDMTDVFGQLHTSYLLYNNAVEGINDLGAYHIYGTLCDRLIGDGYNIYKAGYENYDLSLEKAVLPDGVVNNFYTLSDGVTPRSSALACDIPELSASEISFTNRRRGFVYPRVFVYGSDELSAVNRFISESFSVAGFYNSFMYDAYAASYIAPDISVLLVCEDSLPQLTAGSGDEDAGDRSQMPVILDSAYSDTHSYVIFGTAEEHTTVNIKCGGELTSIRAEHGTFTAQINVDGDAQLLRITAITDGKSESKEQLLRMQGEAVYKNVIIGPDGHLHLSITAHDYTSDTHLSSAELEYYVYMIEEKARQIKSVSPNTQLIIAVPPNKLTVYPETAPQWLQELRGGRETRLRQLARALQHSESVTLLDLTEAVASHKDDGYPLFHKTDTHWNELGAYYGYAELMKHISVQFPAAQPLSLDLFTIETKSIDGGDMADYLGVNLSAVREEAVFVRPRESLPVRINKDYTMNFENAWFSERHEFYVDNERLPTMIMYRDSFSTNLMSYLAQSFSHSLFEQMWINDLNYEEIGSVQPDYVIIELVERNLSALVG